jgi:hypothetical protein
MDSQNIYDLKNIVYIQSQIACAQIELAAMQAENQERSFKGESMAYNSGHFMELINKYNIYHNAVIEMTKSI